MCTSILFINGKDVCSVRQFQETFNVDAKLYGWDGKEEFIDCCMCEIDLKQFFKDHPEHKFVYEHGDWEEQPKDQMINNSTNNQ